MPTDRSVSCCKADGSGFNGHADGCALGEAARRLKHGGAAMTWREIALGMLRSFHIATETQPPEIRDALRQILEWEAFELAREKRNAEEKDEKSNVASLEADHVLSVDEVKDGAPGVSIFNATRMKPLVHALHGGAALCGFEAGKVPGDWPKGHSWANVHDFAKTEREDRCRGCELKIEGSISTK